ncbi:MAG: GntR family transcriptional regulator [Lachnospiraceae bacterium]|nr:GntR family transcriptional regulator [Lachnospiraceae bacterium]
MITLDYRDKRPIYEQIVDKLSELMVKGVLKQDSPMPSVRSLAAELSINPNTVQRSYIELERMGYIYSVRGKGSFVADISGIKNSRSKETERAVEELVKEAKLVGISEEELILIIRQKYEEEEGRRD